MSNEKEKAKSTRDPFAPRVEDSADFQVVRRPAGKVCTHIHTKGSEGVQESPQGVGSAGAKADESQGEDEQALAQYEQDLKDTRDKIQGWADWIDAGSPCGEFLDYIYRARYPLGRAIQSEVDLIKEEDK